MIWKFLIKPFQDLWTVILEKLRSASMLVFWLSVFIIMLTGAVIYLTINLSNNNEETALGYKQCQKELRIVNNKVETLNHKIDSMTLVIQWKDVLCKGKIDSLEYQVNKNEDNIEALTQLVHILKNNYQRGK